MVGEMGEGEMGITAVDVLGVHEFGQERVDFQQK
jgi:hypothetical protein